jgi:hypothetical protein
MDSRALLQSERRNSANDRATCPLMLSGSEARTDSALCRSASGLVAGSLHAYAFLSETTEQLDWENRHRCLTDSEKLSSESEHVP